MTEEPAPRDFTRRTLMANERTFLAWWRTGLTALTAGLATAQIVPRLADTSDDWAFAAIGIALCAIGVTAIVYGQLRRLHVDRAIRRGEFSEPSALITWAITVVGALVGVALIVTIIAI